jgi:homogentisate 1,2-dioxygenase
VPEVLLSNADVSVAISQRAAAMPFAYRDTDADLLYFVHRGTGAFATEFGRLPYESGDYVLIPKGITFSLTPDAGGSHLLAIESPAPLTLTEHQQVGRHMPVDPVVLTVPELCDYDFPSRDEWELRMKHGGAHSSIFYRDNPLVSAGWKGDLFPYELNIRDIIPISSDRIRPAQSAWATFGPECGGAAVISPQCGLRRERVRSRGRLGRPLAGHGVTRRRYFARCGRGGTRRVLTAAHAGMRRTLTG